MSISFKKVAVLKITLAGTNDSNCFSKNDYVKFKVTMHLWNLQWMAAIAFLHLTEHPSNKNYCN